jgi:hypothetical protein
MRRHLVWTVLALLLSACGQIVCQPSPRCQTHDLSIRELDSLVLVAGGGRTVWEFILTNRSGRTCNLSGYPSAVALDVKDRIVGGIGFEHQAGILPGPEHQPMRTIQVKPGGQAWFQVWGNDGMGIEDNTPCRIVTHIRIAPPGGASPFQKTLGFHACLGYPAKISFLVPGTP